MHSPNPRARLPEEIASALAQGTLVLTSSARAARALTRAYAEDARARGAASWPAPAIKDWACWTDELYQQLAMLEPASALPLLHPFEEQLLWTEVQAEEAALVVSPERLALLAQSAYALLSAYNAHAYRRASWAASHEDAERFLAWAERFDRRLAELGSASPCEKEARLAAHLGAHAQTRPDALPHPPALLLVGFDRLTPAQTTLLHAFENAGVPAAHAAIGEPAGVQQLLCAADDREEMRLCAEWARAQLEANPGCRVAVLVPELRGVRAELDRMFRRVLTPRDARSAAGRGAPYEFSLGTPLAKIPLVASALLLLRWLAGPLPAAEVTSLLTGGFLAASADEALALAESDRKLRRAGLLTTELSLSSLVRHAVLPPEPLARLREAQRWARREAARRRSFGAWAEAAAAQLEALGWPGFQELDSSAYQARERWQTLLEEVGALHVAGRATSWSSFVRELSGFARNTLFAAESRGAPVQILGIAEAAGLHFDALWMLGMTEGRWPGTGRGHPLLAPGLQKDLGLPHASQEADLELAQERLRRVLGSSPSVVCSYALQSAGVDARLTPLLRPFAQNAHTLQAGAPPPPTPYMAECRPEPAAVRPWPPERVAGGSEVLKRQAACGFQGFAKRLGAGALEDESWGFDPRERAVLLHRVLEELWSTEAETHGVAKLHTRADLERAIDEDRLDTLVDTAIARAFASHADSEDPWHGSYLALEQQRLRTRVLWWLAEEVKRAPFEVEALERELREVRIGGDPGALRLNLRADRIDRVEGGRLILDYKTGNDVHRGLWEGERPDEPQLPIYALYGGVAEVAGILFAQIRSGKTRLIGIADEPASQLGALPESRGRQGAKESARRLEPETRDAWDHALQALAGEFLRGEAPVNPKHGADTCSLCGLYGVCRVRSRGGALLDKEAGSDEGEEQDA